METTNVLLPTGDRLQIPTGAETLRLKSYLWSCAATARRDYTEFAELVDSMDTHTAAMVLAGMDRYYSGHSSQETMGRHPAGAPPGRPAAVDGRCTCRTRTRS